ncbi:MAG TPA: nuclear transport factor 2 family protein [Thermomicrobiaceae bacterium]|nr:nuclear transport factor 2 family protein [Thermomicrobiaceae bacterium]
MLLERWARLGRVGIPLAIVALLLAPSPSLAASQDPQAVVQSLLAALNAGNLDGAMALVADNATIRYDPPQYGPPNNCCSGKAAIRMAYGSLVAGQGHFEPMTALQVSGDTVTGRVRQTGPGIQKAGLQSIDADLTFTVRNGLMTAQTVAFTPETIAAGFKGIGAPATVMPATGHTQHARAGVLEWTGLCAGLSLLGGLLLVGYANRRRPRLS